jgi:RNase H-like domain found in reverse transcriptase
MYNLLSSSNKKPFKWTIEADRALNRVKEELMKAVILRPPSPSHPYALECDASVNSYGGVLMQSQEGKLVFLGCCSGRFRSTELRYEIWE